MKREHGDTNTPRWLRLAATLRAEPDPATLARVRRRLAARETEPVWLRWLARPAALAVSAALLVVSAWAGNALLASSGDESADASALTVALLGDDGSFGLDLGVAGTASADSDEVTP